MKNILAILLTLLITSGIAPAEEKQSGHKVGEQAANFELKTIDGKQYTLSQLKQQGHVLLIFWATECVYCYAHVEDFNNLHQQYINNGLTLAAINIGGEYDPEVREYVKDNDINYLVLSDRLKNLDVAEAYRVFGTPTMVLVAPSGEIIYRGHEIPDLEKIAKLTRK